MCIELYFYQFLVVQTSDTMPASRPLDETHEFCRGRAPPDGSCLFTSVRHVLCVETMKTNDNLRKEVVDQIRKSADLQQAVRAEFPFMTIEDYCNEMKISTTWAGGIELRALALIYKKLFCVVSVDTSNNDHPDVHIYRFGEDLQNVMECVYLLYTGNKHYDPLYLSEKGDPSDQQTVFGCNDRAVQETLRKFIEVKLGAESKQLKARISPFYLFVWSP